MLGPQTGRQEQFWMISSVPSSVDLSTPLLGHHPMVISLLDWSKVMIWLMKDGNGERKFKLGPIVTMSCHPLDSNAKFALPANPRATDHRLSGTQWLEDLFREPSQTNEPPIPRPSPSSKPHEDVPTGEPELEVAPTQSMEEPFAHPAPPPSVIMVDNMPVRSPSIHSFPRDPQHQAPLISTMSLARNSLTCDGH
ncbi:hypothetical protein O181_020037 [Austropuccinia psidii MF-1]|uniref:Uncharacterized protein n=1 Tax=Austropuccinia psidii MF-1 TaxID=1389203 RepID=A0A9Q3CAY2_9BASI|nr:hypothetical protein [Austropuccinia psidii MF-1]